MDRKQYPYTGPQGETQPPDGVAIGVGQGGPQGNMTGPPSSAQIVPQADRRDGLPWLTGSNVGDFPPWVPRQSQPDPDGITPPGSTPRTAANPPGHPVDLLRPEGNRGDGPPASRPAQAVASFESNGQRGRRDQPTPAQAIASFNAMYDEHGNFAFDDAAHPRDDEGKFVDGEGGGSKSNGDKPKTPQVPALSGMTPLGAKPKGEGEKKPGEEPTPSEAAAEHKPPAVGTKIWHGGDEVEITTEPYELHGGEFQDAKRLSDGKKVVVKTESARAKDVERTQKEWKEQQAGFRRLREAQSKKDKGSSHRRSR